PIVDFVQNGQAFQFSEATGKTQPFVFSGPKGTGIWAGNDDLTFILRTDHSLELFSGVADLGPITLPNTVYWVENAGMDGVVAVFEQNLAVKMWDNLQQEWITVSSPGSNISHQGSNGPQPIGFADAYGNVVNGFLDVEIDDLRDFDHNEQTGTM